MGIFGKKKIVKSDSEFAEFVQSISTVPCTGWVKVTTAKGESFTFDYYAPVPTEDILRQYVIGLKIKGVTKAEFISKKKDANEKS